MSRSTCESVVPASIDGTVEIRALVKEAYCKGAGDMMTEYSYVLNSVGRSKDKKGQTKEESTTYEVFIPTLKSGTHAKGILVVTSRNGVPVAGGRAGKSSDAGGRAPRKSGGEERARNSIAARDRLKCEGNAAPLVGILTAQPTIRVSAASKAARRWRFLLFSGFVIWLWRVAPRMTAGKRWSSILLRAPTRNLPTTRNTSRSSPARFGSTPRIAS
ncbi:MAG TPA: hypothetical protein VLQ90_02025 [Pyrinomonadaceae bacterium]|nr:hypothetical protein [Pyrinomonadaceae bacterium]